MKKLALILLFLTCLMGMPFADEGFFVTEIDDSLMSRMKGKSYKENCPIPVEDLRYVHVLHKDLSGDVHDGELVCNVYIAQDVLEIFKALYEAGYPIERVRLVDDYNADDETSMRDNNSSSFNYRPITGSTKISKHGLGLAVDINTLYNPYVKGEHIEPSTAGAYVDRSKNFPYKIESGDLCYKLFTERGFEWGGNWKSLKDYQHFEVSDQKALELYPNYR